MAGSVQGFLQTPLPLVDVTLSPFNTTGATALGGAINKDSFVPPGAIQQNTLGQWIFTGTAGNFVTDSGGTGDLLSGIELSMVNTPGTYQGCGPNYGYAGRLSAPPVGTLVLPMSVNLQCYRFEVFGLRWDVAPTGTQAGQDSGVVFTVGGAANGPIYDISKAVNGGQSTGFGILYDSAGGVLRFVAKQVSGNGNPLTAFANIGNPTNGVAKPFYLDMRILAPTVSTAAAIQIFLDKTQVVLTTAQSSWAPGTVLPALPGGPSNGIGLMPAILNNSPATDTANPALHFTSARLRIGSLAACTLENQF